MIAPFFFLRFLVGLTIAVITCIYLWKRRISRYSNASKQTSTELADSPIVTVTASTILLDSHMKMIAGAKAALEDLTKQVCVFVIVPVRDGSQMNALQSQMKIEFQGVIPCDHILYAQTGLGRVLMARQLEARAHFDFDPDVIQEASLFMKTVLIASSCEVSNSQGWKANGFEEFFTERHGDFCRFLKQSDWT
jgi:hypothetical protein